MRKGFLAISINHVAGFTVRLDWVQDVGMTFGCVWSSSRFPFDDSYIFPTHSGYFGFKCLRSFDGFRPSFHRIQPHSAPAIQCTQCHIYFLSRLSGSGGKWPHPSSWHQYILYPVEQQKAEAWAECWRSSMNDVQLLLSWHIVSGYTRTNAGWNNRVS